MSIDFRLSQNGFQDNSINLIDQTGEFSINPYLRIGKNMKILKVKELSQPS
jgi:hypothetical protein